MQHTLRRLFTCLGYIALGCYLLLVIAFLGIRYWALPNIDQWREPLAQQLSQALSVQVELGEISAQWHGRAPRIQLKNAALHDEDGRLLLQLPSLDVALDWSTLWSGTPTFSHLHAQGVELALRRDAQDRISLVGYELGSNEQESADVPAGTGVLHWLSRQGDLSLTQARITWLDESRQAPPLVLESVSLGIFQRSGVQLFSVVATPPPAMGEQFKLLGRVSVDTQPGRAFSLADVSGLFHVDVAAMRPAGWQPWLDVHSALDQGRVSWQAWQRVERGVAQHHVSQVRVEGGSWKPEQGLAVKAEKAELYLAGNWDALLGLFSTGDSAEDEATALPKVRVAMQMQGLSIEAGEVFEQPLAFEAVTLATDLQRGPETGLQLHVDHAELRNADMDLQLQGSWRQYGAGAAGLADFQGRFERAELSAIVRYLPAIVDDDAKQWMRHGLLAGRLLEAPVRLQGDLVQFPFGDQPESGDFFVGGKVQDVIIDYAPAAVIGEPGWPRLESLQGSAQLHKVDLSIRADAMQMRPGQGIIQLSDVAARIPNIERGSVLVVEGLGQAPASAFLELIRESPLDALLDGMFQHAQGDGQWQVPIALTIPLTNVSATEVQGEVKFDKAALSIDPAYPALTQLSGRLAFSDTQMVSHDLSGRSLGGPVKISGGIGKDQPGLVFQGSTDAKALNDYFNGRLAGMVEGKAPYRLTMQRGNRSRFALVLESSLEGLAINLPPPLQKMSSQAMALRATWTPAASAKQDTVLSVKLAELLNLKLLHRDAKDAKGSFFHAGALGVQTNVETPSSGLTVDIRSASVDLDAWRRWGKGIGDGPTSAQGAPAALFPPVRDFRLQADQATLLGMALDQLTFTARRPEGERWRLDVSSTQTAGTVFWRESRGRIEGDIEAHFQRLALGEAGSDNSEKASEESGLSLADDIDFPAIRLTVDKLRLYGREVGALSVVGLNDVQAHRWKLEQLQLAGPHATLKGSGVWQLTGPQRGLTLQAQALFDDLGAYLEQAGFHNLVEGGHGQVEGVIEWRELPWKFELSDLQGDLRVDLAKGRFVDVGSRSARLLELLSLQSVQRLASFNWNPGGLLKEGFPFDSLLGHIKVNDGVLHSENYRVTGPVATIVIAGDVDLPQENLDLYAVVVPNLDVSGAAIAAGIAVNPIVGVGAFLTQWLLKHPMSKAMTVEYRVRGGFDSPEIKAIETEGEKGTLPGHPVSGDGRG